MTEGAKDHSPGDTGVISPGDTGVISCKKALNAELKEYFRILPQRPIIYFQSSMNPWIIKLCVSSMKEVNIGLQNYLLTGVITRAASRYP